MEIWKDITGYEGLYQVSDRVRIKSVKRVIEVRKSYGIIKKTIAEKILVPGIGNGYHTVSLWKNNQGRTHKISVLAAIAFIPNPDNLPIVNHLDGVKTNDKLSNYEWASYSGNTVHAVENGLINYAKGESAAQSKLTEQQVLEIRAIIGKSNRVIAKEYNVTHTVINAIKQRKTWKHI